MPLEHISEVEAGTVSALASQNSTVLTKEHNIPKKRRNKKGIMAWHILAFKLFQKKGALRNEIYEDTMR